MSSSVIFIGSPQKSNKISLKNLICINPNDVIFRIFASFIPPFGPKFRKVYVDIQGPLLALLTLIAFVNYGSNVKITKPIGYPTESVVFYVGLMPILCYILSRLGKSNIQFIEIVSLVGYSLYGHILTLFVSFLCFQESSNTFFFLCLIVFGGLSTFRMIMVFLWTIPLPVARLLICTFVGVANILFLIFLHFAYMHRTFVYNGRG